MRVLLERWTRRPDLFCSQALGFLTWPGQDRILNAVARLRATGSGGTVAVPTGHGVSKSRSLAVLVLWFLTIEPEVSVITTASVARQVEKVGWREIHKVLQGARVPFSSQPKATEFTLAPNRFALGLTTNEPDRFAGWHSALVVVIADEASGIKRPIWDAISGSTSGQRDIKILLGQPIDPESYMYDACSGKIENTEVVHISSEEAADWNDAQPPELKIPGLVSRRWIEEKRAEWGEESPMFQARVLGLFPKESEEALIRLAWIEASADRWENADPEDEEDVVPVVGCDVARHGADKAVWFVLKGRRVIHVEELARGDLMRVAGMTAAVAKRFGARSMAIDDTGMGGGVTDRLMELGWDVSPINFGSAPHDPEKFVDRRTELWWNVREALRENRLDVPRQDELLRDLLAPRYTYTSRGKLKLEPKEQTKKRLGRSPDYGDALAIAWAAHEGASADWGVDDVILGVPKHPHTRRLV